MRIVHVNLVRPRGRPDPEELLERWPTLGRVAAASGAVAVVQPFYRDAEVWRDGLKVRFVREGALPGRSSGIMPWRIARAVREEAAEVIHLNGLDFPLHTRWLTAMGIPVLAQDHASAPGLRGRRFGLARIAGAAFTAAEQAAPFVAAGEISGGVPIFAIPESSTMFSAGSQAQARAAIGLWGNPAVLWVGRLDRNKDPLTVLEGVARASHQLPGLVLWCCFQTDTLLAEVKAMIAARPELQDRVRLVGRVPHAQIETWLRAADLYVSASRREGSGYALIEAMACGLWPVVSAIPSFRALTGGDVGTLFPAGDAGALARALVSAAACAGERARVSGHFQRHLSFAAIGARLREAYAAL